MNMGNFNFYPIIPVAAPGKGQVPQGIPQNSLGFLLGSRFAPNSNFFGQNFASNGIQSFAQQTKVREEENARDAHFMSSKKNTGIVRNRGTPSDTLKKPREHLAGSFHFPG
jgi:hypothetical protein